MGCLFSSFLFVRKVSGSNLIINSDKCFITNLLTGPHIATDELK